MKEMNHSNEDEFLEYINSKIGFSLDNFMTIKGFLQRPDRQVLDKSDKEDVLGFFSTYGLIPSNFKKSKTYQNSVFQKVEENKRKQEIINRIQRKMEKKKNESNQEIKDDIIVLNQSVEDIDKELKDLNLNIEENDSEDIKIDIENNNNMKKNNIMKKKNKKNKNKKNKRK